MTTARTVTCPACQGPSVYAPENAYRPFCSRRCKEHDFGAWANEEHRLPQAPSSDELDPDQDPDRELGADARSSLGLGLVFGPSLGGLGADDLPELPSETDAQEPEPEPEPAHLLPPKRLQ